MTKEIKPMKGLVALLFAAMVSNAHAAVAPSFEQSLGQFRSEFIALRAQQAKTKALQASSDIDPLASETDRVRWETQDLRNAVNDLKFRVQRQRPGGDPWIRNDLSRMVSTLRDYARFVQDLEWRGTVILQNAQKDPAAVPAAQRLQSAAGWLRSETGWLQMDAQNAAWDFRRAGFSMEAFDLENAARDAQTAAQNLESTANRILERVGAKTLTRRVN